MEIFSSLYKNLYEENLDNLTSEVAKGLGRIAEIYWEKLPLEKRRRVVLKHDANVLTLEYLPKTYLELMEYARKDYSERKKIEINLKEEATKLLEDLHKSGAYFRFKTYIEKNLLHAEDVLIRIGYGEKVYHLIKKSLEYLLTRKENGSEKNLRAREIIRFIPFFFLFFLIFFASGSTTGLFYLPYEHVSPFMLLVCLFLFLIFFLFFC
ncbi:MAG: hypothetical protein NZ942_00245 [Candidatus Aenigmarchaeota archaeon]|nr:hypothetical protein [Candidatus Aenigmarchaeota archaeon]